MNRLFRIRPALLLLLVVLTLSGCRSSRGGGNRSSTHKRQSEWKSNHRRPDYSREQSDQMGRDLVEEARRWMGTPYRYGGQDRNGTDCSGLVMQVYKNVCEVKLPRTTTDQRVYCLAVPRDRTRVGDLVFFSSGGGKGSVNHVGLYIGNGEMIHASSSRGVMVSPVDTGYWSERFQGIGRVAGAAESWASLPRNRKRKRTDDRSTLPLPSPELPVAAITAPPAATPVPKSAPEVPLAALIAAGNTPEAADTAAVAAASASSLDMLDAAISEKVDSIFSSQFLD